MLLVRCVNITIQLSKVQVRGKITWKLCSTRKQPKKWGRDGECDFKVNINTKTYLGNTSARMTECETRQKLMMVNDNRNCNVNHRDTERYTFKPGVPKCLHPTVTCIFAGISLITKQCKLKTTCTLIRFNHVAALEFEF